MNGVKTKNINKVDNSYDVEVDFDNAIVKIKNDLYKKQEYTSSSTETKSNADKVIFANKADNSVYTINNNDKTYEASSDWFSYYGSTTLEAYVLKNADTYYKRVDTENFYSDALDLEESYNAAKEITYYIDGQTYTSSGTLDYGKLMTAVGQKGYEGTAEFTYQITIDGANISCYSETKLNFTYKDTVKKHELSSTSELTTSIKLEISENKVFMKSEKNSKSNVEGTENDISYTKTVSDSEFKKETVKFGNVSISTSLDGYVKNN